MIPRCIEDKKEAPTGETSAFALVLLVNNTVVNESFSMKSFEDCTTYVFLSWWSDVQLSQCLLREEVRSGYLSKEKKILCKVLNENKGAKQQKDCAPGFFVSAFP